jgi:hypothetical protein
MAATIIGQSVDDLLRLLAYMNTDQSQDDDRRLHPPLQEHFAACRKNHGSWPSAGAFPHAHLRNADSD